MGKIIYLTDQLQKYCDLVRIEQINFPGDLLGQTHELVELGINIVIKCIYSLIQRHAIIEGFILRLFNQLIEHWPAGVYYFLMITFLLWDRFKRQK